jgi:hypothetical protein
VNYKNYWRKTGLKKPYGDQFISFVNNINPKNFLEIGVFCGVTARNICELLKKNHLNNFSYYGLDLFGSEKKNNTDEIEPLFLKHQNFSNPLKKIYYNYILKENLNSMDSVSKFLRNFSDNIKLIKGDTKETLNNVPLENINFTFLDGGHSYETVTSDLTILLNRLPKQSHILCDDYCYNFEIKEVSSAIQDVCSKHKIKVIEKFSRFAHIVKV